MAYAIEDRREAQANEGNDVYHSFAGKSIFK